MINDIEAIIGLPTVTKEKIKALELGISQSQTYVRDSMASYARMNPFLMKGLEEIASLGKRAEILIGGLLVYDLLQRSGALPVVEPSTVQEARSEMGRAILSGRDLGTYLRSVADRIAEKNPVLAGYFAQKLMGPWKSLGGEVDEAGVFVYRALEKQAEINKTGTN